MPCRELARAHPESPSFERIEPTIICRRTYPVGASLEHIQGHRQFSAEFEPYTKGAPCMVDCLGKLVAHPTLRRTVLI